MSKNIRTQLGKVIGKSLNGYHNRVKPTIDELKFKEEYQGRIIDCMVGEVDDNYIETPETDSSIVKLEHSKEGVVKIPSIKGKTILVDADGQITDTLGEGCRLVSVGEDEDNKLIILSKNKNLFNDSDLIMDTYYGSDGVPRKDVGTTCIKVNKINPNSTYKVSGTNINRLEIWEYDNNGNFLCKGNPNTSNYTFTLNNKSTINVVIKIAYYQNNSSLVSNIQVEEGIVGTSYAKSKQHETEILLDEPLRSLPNGVCDEIVGNKLIRRIGYYLFNGEEGLSPNLNRPFYQEDYPCVFIPMARGHRVLKNKKAKQRGGFKNNVLGKEQWDFSDDVEGFRLSGNFDMHIRKNRFSTLDRNGVNEFLQNLYNNNQPLEMIYELEEPIIEELPNGITLQGFDDTTMYIENSITPTVSYGYNALIPYKEELRTQKEEVEINTLDIENNIIPYLMDMEFSLMTMEGDINGTEG